MEGGGRWEVWRGVWGESREVGGGFQGGGEGVGLKGMEEGRGNWPPGWGGAEVG